MDANEGTTEDSASTRERSQIEFPYADLGAAEEVVRKLYDKGGGSAEPTQLAVWMNTSPNGGTFRSRVSAARIFGFIDTSRGAISITERGKGVLKDDLTDTMRVEAFLNVPLFAKMFEKFSGDVLPPPAAIENQMLDVGVPIKQKERARQVFQKSAMLANFIDGATGRFVKPAVRQHNGPPLPPERNDPPPDERRLPDEKKVDHHPFVAGLLSELPQGNTYGDWSIEDQAEWLRAAASIFKLLSKQTGRISVEVVSKNEGASS